MEDRIEILMATYNGGKYIREQIESLLAQTYSNWILRIRDDGSKDKTLEIVEEYIKKYPEKISVLKDGKGSLKAQYNFLELLKNSTENHIMFCDQDDVWLPEKIEKTLKMMLEKEKIEGKDTPILIYTDLKIVDESLNLISESFWEYQNINYLDKNYKELIIQNNVTGCTVMMNNALKKITILNYSDVIMHDWLIAILAKLKGKSYAINESLILYRQHSKNCAGARKSNETISDKFKKIKILNNQIIEAKKQIKSIIEKIEIEQEKREIINTYINLKNKSFYSRKIWLIKNKFLFEKSCYKTIIQLFLE